MREAIGSVTEVARRLGCSRQVVHRREAGTVRITGEAALALTALAFESRGKKKPLSRP
jgi:transposase-like protein